MPQGPEDTTLNELEINEKYYISIINFLVIVMIDVRADEHCGAKSNYTETSMLLFHQRSAFGGEPLLGFQIRVLLCQKSTHVGDLI